MTTILERLRSARDSEYVPVYDEDGYDGISVKLIKNAALCHEAADEIEALRSLLTDLANASAVLRPADDPGPTPTERRDLHLRLREFRTTWPEGHHDAPDNGSFPHE